MKMQGGYKLEAFNDTLELINKAEPSSQ